MNKKIVSGTMLVLVLLGTLTLAFDIQLVKASGTIYIRADGSIDPPTAPIYTADNVTYVFTDDIFDSVVVERSNVVVDGADYTIQGTGSGYGITISEEKTNVTIKNTNIESFYCGIELHSCSRNVLLENNISANSFYGVFLDHSSNNTIYGNNIANNYGGIRLYFSSNNTVKGNNIEEIDDTALSLEYPGGYWQYNTSNNTITGNSLTNIHRGILLSGVWNNVIYGNNITSANYGILFRIGSIGSFSNNVSENVIANCTYGIHLASKYNIIQENSVINSTSMGIYLEEGSYHNILSGNNITQSHDYSILLHQTNANSLGGNIIRDNQKGIWLDSSSYNSIYENTIVNNTNDGLYLLYSDHTSLYSNNLTVNNGNGISLNASYSTRISQNYITHNTNGVCLNSSSNYNSISENYLESNQNGVLLNSSTSNCIDENNITNNINDGIRLLLSSNYNNIAGNNITNNQNGVWLSNSSNNTIYYNNFMDNDKQVYDESWDNPSIPSSINAWDIGYPSGGNHWSDYTGVDADGDGVGDTPYTIDAYNQDNYTFMNPWESPPEVHDVAIMNIAFSKTVIGQGFTGYIYGTVENQGNYTENFYATAYANMTPVATVTGVTLASGNFTTIAFEWNTIGWTRGVSYTISLQIPRVQNETDTGNNLYIDGIVKVTIAGDINGDYHVGIKDATLIGINWMKTVPPADPNVDINGDGIINIKDAAILGANWGKNA